MSTVRSIVFPALRLLVWAVIAAALVVLAFRGSDVASEPAGGAGPSFVDVQSPPIPVGLATVSNTVSVSGTVVADPSVPVKATAAGEVGTTAVTSDASKPRVSATTTRRGRIR